MAWNCVGRGAAHRKIRRECRIRCLPHITPKTNAIVLDGPEGANEAQVQDIKGSGVIGVWIVAIIPASGHVAFVGARWRSGFSSALWQSGFSSVQTYCCSGFSSASCGFSSASS